MSPKRLNSRCAGSTVQTDDCFPLWVSEDIRDGVGTAYMAWLVVSWPCNTASYVTRQRKLISGLGFVQLQTVNMHSAWLRPTRRLTASVQSRQTSSSAVAKRPRDASCLSVVSFNSTKRRAQSFTASYIGYRFITAYNYMLFCLLFLA